LVSFVSFEFLLGLSGAFLSQDVSRFD